MFPNDLWISDPNEGKLYKVENDVVASNVHVEKEARSILVSQDMVSVYTVNRTSNTVSHFRDGSHIKDITVGKTPWGICEDSNKNIYVANYKDNTVSKIKNDEVVETYTVEKGPQGLVCDDNDNLYVACSLSNTVVRLVNGVKVDSIEVGLSPQGITCDPFGNIWTANYGSNTVSKITNGFKILDVEVDKGPIAIVSDSSGSIYVANYLSDNVTVLGNGAKEPAKNIPVGDGPTAISVNRENAVYVTSGLGEDVRKIVAGSVVATIEVCPNPSAFGDFTGCSTYNIYNVGSGETSPGVPSDGWKLADLEQSVQDAINLVTNEQVITNADKVEYTKEEEEDVTNVKEALDKLFDAGSTDIETVKSDVEKLKTTVGDSGSGLVKDVSDLKTATSELGTIKTNADKVPTLESSVSELQTAVGSGSDGLTKDVADLKTTVGSSGSGLVKDVTDLKTSVGGAESGLVKDVSDLKTATADLTGIKTNADKVPTLETTVGNEGSGLVKDVNDLKTATSGLESIKTNADKVPTIEGSVSTLQTNVTKLQDEYTEVVTFGALSATEAVSSDILVLSEKSISKIVAFGPADATVTQAITVTLEQAALGTASYNVIDNATATFDVSESNTNRLVEADLTSHKINVTAQTRIHVKLTNIKAEDSIKGFGVVVYFAKKSEE